jgi:hypothetical protein
MHKRVPFWLMDAFYRHICDVHKPNHPGECNWGWLICVGLQHNAAR